MGTVQDKSKNCFQESWGGKLMNPKILLRKIIAFIRQFSQRKDNWGMNN